MDELDYTQVRRALNGFDGVWRRVNGPGDPPDRPGPEGGEENKTLRRFIADEMALRRDLRSLARASRDNMERRTLNNLASEAAMRIRRLRAELFIRSGELDDTRVKPRPDRDPLTSLREALDDARDLAGDYRTASRRTQDRELEQLNEEYARQTEQTANQLRRLILRRFR